MILNKPDKPWRIFTQLDIKSNAYVFFFVVFDWFALKSLSPCFKLWISFKMQIKLLLGGTEEGSRGLCLTRPLTKEAVFLHIA